jgi:hypothetical protein
MLARRGRRRIVLAIALIGVVFGVAGPVVAQIDDDQLTASRFSILVGGQEVATFDSLIELTRTLRGKPAVELDGPYTEDDSEEDWLQEAQRDPTAGRKNFVLIAYSTDSVPVARYYFTKGSPVTIRIHGLKAGASEVLLLRVKFTAEGITRVPPA